MPGYRDVTYLGQQLGCAENQEKCNRQMRGASIVGRAGKREDTHVRRWQHVGDGSVVL